ncbi:MAG TPA: VWA domain-containing protein, partial [Candidatus Acidoferrales bacterium]|nr:VWA domain-containing protein [Candidatus Acidoferrales bacterium]
MRSLSLFAAARRGGFVRRARSLSCLAGLALLLFPLLGTTLLGQDQSKVSVEVKVVTVLATVRDNKGKIAPDLDRSAFHLEEDGRQQTISYFEKESGLPLTLGLLVDTSLSQRLVLGEERTASGSFLDHLMRVEKDKAFIIHFDHEVELLQDMTSSRSKLQNALDLLQMPQMSRPSSGGGSGSGGSSGGGGGMGGGGGQRQHRGGGGTLLYDAIYLASNEMMQKQQGRKAVVVLTDGVDHGSKETLEGAVESAQRSDTVVYSILFTGEEGSGRGPGGGGFGGYGGGRHGGGRQQQESRPDGKKVLERLSGETGGRMFQVSKKETIEAIYA